MGIRNQRHHERHADAFYTEDRNEDAEQCSSKPGWAAVGPDHAQPLEPFAQSRAPDPLDDHEVEETEAEEQEVVASRKERAFG